MISKILVGGNELCGIYLTNMKTDFFSEWGNFSMHYYFVYCLLWSFIMPWTNN